MGIARHYGKLTSSRICTIATPNSTRNVLLSLRTGRDVTGYRSVNFRNRRVSSGPPIIITISVLSYVRVVVVGLVVVIVVVVLVVVVVVIVVVKERKAKCSDLTCSLKTAQISLVYHMSQTNKMKKTTIISPTTRWLKQTMNRRITNCCRS